MGGGSGRAWGYSDKRVVEDCAALDVNWMIREGIFDGSGLRSGMIRWSHAYTGENTSSMGYEINIPQRWLRLRYKLVREEESFDYKVPLTTSPLPWGGVRWWFVCALTSDGRYCGRRVGKLYLPFGERYYGCRHCYGLTYRSCRESHGFDRLLVLMAEGIGTTLGDVKRIWEDDPKSERRMECQARRNEQRRRRRKARSWA